jgi:hypothetical protein
VVFYWDFVVVCFCKAFSSPGFRIGPAIDSITFIKQHESFSCSSDIPVDACRGRHEKGIDPADFWADLHVKDSKSRLQSLWPARASTVESFQDPKFRVPIGFNESYLEPQYIKPISDFHKTKFRPCGA